MLILNFQEDAKNVDQIGLYQLHCLHCHKMQCCVIVQSQSETISAQLRGANNQLHGTGNCHFETHYV